MLGLGFVCDDPDCQERAKNACRSLPCGHMCGGVKDDTYPVNTGVKNRTDDMCMVCYTDVSVRLRLDKSRVFHFTAP